MRMNHLHSSCLTAHPWVIPIEWEPSNSTDAFRSTRTILLSVRCSLVVSAENSLTARSKEEHNAVVAGRLFTRLYEDIPHISPCSPSLQLPWRMPDQENSPPNTWNNSAWIDSCPSEFEPNCVGDAPAADHVRMLTADLIQHLIQFLNEFLPFLSSFVDGHVRYCQIQRTSMMNVIQHLLRLRADLLAEMNNYAQYPLSVISFDIATVSIILQQLNALLRHLDHQEQCSTSNATSTHRGTLIQWGNQLEGLIAVSMSIMDTSSNDAVSDGFPVVSKIVKLNAWRTTSSLILDFITNHSWHRFFGS